MDKVADLSKFTRESIHLNPLPQVSGGQLAHGGLTGAHDSTSTGVPRWSFPPLS